MLLLIICVLVTLFSCVYKHRSNLCFFYRTLVLLGHFFCFQPGCLGTWGSFWVPSGCLKHKTQFALDQHHELWRTHKFWQWTRLAERSIPWEASKWLKLHKRKYNLGSIDFWYYLNSIPQVQFFIYEWSTCLDSL